MNVREVAELSRGGRLLRLPELHLAGEELSGGNRDLHVPNRRDLGRGDGVGVLGRVVGLGMIYIMYNMCNVIYTYIMCYIILYTILHYTVALVY